MKSIKLASGFAVSALALAIAGQATAQEATTEVEFTGSVKVNTVLDFDADTRQNSMPGYADAEGDWFNLNATWSVTHGPFSGDIRVGIHEDDTAGIDGDDNNGTVFVDNLRVDEGPISFGQIGGVTDTADLLETLTDFDAMAGGKEATLKFDVDAAARYTVSDLGLRVQAEGALPDGELVFASADDEGTADAGGRNWGVGASIMQDLDVATVWADAQFREYFSHQVQLVDDFDPADGDPTLEDVNVKGTVDSFDGMGDSEFTFGFGVEATPADMVTLTGVFRNNSLADTSGYALRADVDATDELSVFGVFADADTETDDTAAMHVGLTYSMAPLTLEASYQANVDRIDEALIMSKVSYTEGMITGYAEFNYSMEGFEGGDNAAASGDDYEFVLGAEYAYDSGVVLGGEYTNAGSDYYDGESDQFEAFAKYSF